MYRWLPRWPLWDGLNRLGKSRILKTSYVWLLLVPMVAQALAKIEDPLILDGISHGLRIQIALPFNWWLFYFSAVSVSIAGVIYSLVCPKLVREFSNLAEYRAEGRGKEYLLDYADHMQHQAKTGKEGWDAANFSQDAKKVGEDNLGELFWDIHKKENSRFPFWRAACCLLYSAGLLLIAIVLLQNFMFVVHRICS